MGEIERNRLGQPMQIRTTTNVRAVTGFWEAEYGRGSLDELFDGMDAGFKRICLYEDTFVPLIWEGYIPFGDIPDIHNVQTLVWRTIRKEREREKGNKNAIAVMEDIGRRSSDLASSEIKASLKVAARVLGSRTPSLKKLKEHAPDHNNILSINTAHPSSRLAEVYLDYVCTYTSQRILGIDHLAEAFTRGSILDVDNMMGDGKSMGAHHKIFQAGIADMLFSHLMYSDERFDFEFRDDGLYIGGEKVGLYVNPDSISGFSHLKLPRNPSQDQLKDLFSLRHGVNFLISDTKPEGEITPVYITDDFNVDGFTLLQSGSIYGAQRSVLDLTLPKSVFLFSYLKSKCDAFMFAFSRGYDRLRKELETSRRLLTEREGALDETRVALGTLKKAFRALADVSALVAHDTINPMSALEAAVNNLQANEGEIFDGIPNTEIALIKGLYLEHGSKWRKALLAYTRTDGELEPEVFKPLYTKYSQAQKAPLNRLGTHVSKLDDLFDTYGGTPEMNKVEAEVRGALAQVEEVIRVSRLAGTKAREVIERTEPLTKISVDGEQPHEVIEEINLADIVRDSVRSYQQDNTNVSLYLVDFPQRVDVYGNKIWVNQSIENIFNNARTQLLRVQKDRKYGDDGIYLWIDRNRLYVGNTGPEILNHDIVYQSNESTTGGQGVALHRAKRRLAELGCELNHVRETTEIKSIVDLSPYSGTNINVVFYIEFKNTP